MQPATGARIHASDSQGDNISSRALLGVSHHATQSVAAGNVPPSVVRSSTRLQVGFYFWVSISISFFLVLNLFFFCDWFVNRGSFFIKCTTHYANNGRLRLIRAQSFSFLVNEVNSVNQHLPQRSPFSELLLKKTKTTSRFSGANCMQDRHYMTRPCKWVRCVKLSCT